MFKALLARARQGYRTANYPAHDPALPALFRGRPDDAEIGRRLPGEDSGVFEPSPD